MGNISLVDMGSITDYHKIASNQLLTKPFIKRCSASRAMKTII